MEKERLPSAFQEGSVDEAGFAPSLRASQNGTQLDTVGTGAAHSYELSEALLQMQMDERRLQKELKATQGKILQMQQEWQRREQEWKERVESIDRERRDIRERLDLSDARYNVILKEYEELYRYCETLLKDSDLRRKALEENLSQTEMAKTEVEIELKAKKEEIVRLQADTRAQVERLMLQLDEAISNGAHAAHGLEQAHQEKNQVTVRLQAYSQQATQIEESLARGKDLLNKTLCTMVEIQKATARYVDGIENNGPSPLSLRAGRLLAEQWRLELENLRKVEEDILKAIRNKVL